MENASTFAKLLIEALLNVHALTCMYRATGNAEHRKAAQGWLKNLEDLLASLRRELEESTHDR